LERAVGEAQRSKLTTLDAVTTDHTTRGIHGMCLEIDAGSLAVLGTHRAVSALVDIKVNLQQ
jgi:hypothetical protein